MEQLLIGLVLGLFLEGKNYHETPQNERRSQPQTVLSECLPKPLEELCRQSPSRWYPAVTDAMPKPRVCQ